MGGRWGHADVGRGARHRILVGGRRMLGLVTMVAAWLPGGGCRPPAPRLAERSTSLRPARLEVTRVLGIVLVLWIAVVVLTFLMVRPSAYAVGHRRGRGRGSGADRRRRRPAAVLPVATSGDFVKSVFENNHSATAPRRGGGPVGHPRSGQRPPARWRRGAYRDGVRTDSMILVSVDTHTGRAVSSACRATDERSVPVDSPLHQVFRTASPVMVTRRLDAQRGLREVPILYRTSWGSRPTKARMRSSRRSRARPACRSTTTS